MLEPNVTYSEIASEYYDPDLHKTSRNFDEASRDWLLEHRGILPSFGLVLDAGAGRGRCVEYLGVAPDRVIQLDTSAEMLELSPREASLIRIRHSAHNLPFMRDQFGVVAAFLCDPFFGLGFLAEARRVL